jgi:hypothetical protein
MSEVTIALKRWDVYRHLVALCNDDNRFAMRKAEIDDDLEALTIVDAKEAGRLGGKAKGAVVGTVRLLPAGDNTVVMFVHKDALWHLEISDPGKLLFLEFIQRVTGYFDRLGVIKPNLQDTSRQRDEAQKEFVHHLNLAREHQRSGNSIKARDEAGAALELNPDGIEANRIFAWAHEDHWTAISRR